MDRYSANDFGENLKEIRKKKYYTQKDLAKAISLDQARISRLEQGKALPNVEILVLIANELNTSVGALLRNRQYKSKSKQKS